MAALEDRAVTAHPPRAFVTTLAITLMAAGFNAFMVALMALRLDAFLPGAFAQMGHFADPHHRMHDVTFGLLYLPPVFGLLAQFRRPRRNVAGMVMTLVPAAALVTVLAITAVQGGSTRVLQPPWVIVMAGALCATALHPAGSDFFRSFRLARLDRTMLALVGVAAVALLPLALTNIRLQAGVPDDHAAAGHYGFMAAFALAILAMGLLASMRPDGWRLAAWTTGLLPLLAGGTSLVYPDATSSLDPLWALVTMAWGVLFVAAAERSRPAGTGSRKR